MGAYDIEDAMAWKKKIELVIDQVYMVIIDHVNKPQSKDLVLSK